VTSPSGTTTIGWLFDWLQKREVDDPDSRWATSPSAWPRRCSETLAGGWCPQSAHWCAAGRSFDVTGGWQGRHHTDVPVVVVTTEVPTDWVDAHPGATVHLRDRRVAGRSRSGTDARWRPRRRGPPVGTIARQGMDLGLTREVAVDLRPGSDGRGQPPLLGKLSADDVLLGIPIGLRSGRRVTHSCSVVR